MTHTKIRRQKLPAFIPAALLFLLLLSSCGRPGGTGTDSAADYFPDISGVVRSYESPTEPGLNQDVTYAYTNGNRVERIYQASSYVMTEVLQIEADKVTLVYAGSGGFFEDLTGAAENQDMVLLQTPIAKGNKWQTSDGASCEITDAGVAVDTPSGAYDCIEVTMRTDAGTLGTLSGRTSKLYYAKGVGMVKTAYTMDGGASYEIALVKTTENSGLTYSITVYLPGGDQAAGNYPAVRRPFTVTTNYDLAATLAAALRAGEDGVGLIAPGASLASFEIDRDARAAKAALTAGFAGKNNPEDVLTCLGYTIGQFFGVDRVSFTVNGERAGAEDSYAGSPPRG